MDDHADRADDGVGGADAGARRRLGEHLRQVRHQQRWSLHDVEVASDGDFKASVLGAYERGDRTLSVERLHHLAEFYRLPVEQLLPPEPRSAPPREDVGVVIDLTALERRRDEQPVLVRYVEAVRERRGDTGARVLTVRGGDLTGLAAAAGRPEVEVTERLRSQGVLL